MDHDFTQRVASYLAQPIAERPLEEGAEMLLQLNRNQHMHALILRKQDRQLLDYQLTKHLRIREAGYTLDQAHALDVQVTADVAKTLAEDAPPRSTDDAPTLPTDGDTPQSTRHGRRPDHDTLPEAVKALYVRGGELFFRMRQTHHTLSQMQDAPTCDRAELCFQLKALHDEYRTLWETYDTYTPEDKKKRPKKRKV